jgi:hypothetical protein
MPKKAAAQTNQTVTAFFKRRTVRALVGIVAIGFSYIFFLYALDSGNLLAYLMIGVFVFIALREFFGAVNWRARA